MEATEIFGSCVSTFESSFIVKVLTVKGELMLPLLSVTLILQLLYVPALRVLKVMVLFPEVTDVVELLQLPS